MNAMYDFQEFHEIWWLYSTEDAPWAGLRIAHFRKTVNGELIVLITGESLERAGLRIWADIEQREHWYKVAQIAVPTADQVRLALVG